MPTPSLPTEAAPVATLDNSNTSNNSDGPTDRSRPPETVNVVTNNNNNNNNNHDDDAPVKLYKSSRMKGYVTLVLSSIVNYDAARHSDTVIAAVAVPASRQQHGYAVALSSLSLGVSSLILVLHLDRVSPWRKTWAKAFASGSKIELLTSMAFVIWWSIGTGIQTSVTGVAGDGKGQFSLYFSSWACTLTSFWILERWWVDAGLSSFKSFISSWPNRAPGWISILLFDSLTLLWYWDLWANHDNLNRQSELRLRNQFELVPEYQWTLLLTISGLTLVPSLAFVLVELCRGTKSSNDEDEDDDENNNIDNVTTNNQNKSNNAETTASRTKSIVGKGRIENYVEGVCIVLVFLAWIPCIMVATTPGGPAALIGNAYFFSWLSAILITETAVWYIHDLRQHILESIERKQEAYRKRQLKVMNKTEEIQRKELMREEMQRAQSDVSEQTWRRPRMDTFFFDARDADE